MQSIDFIEIYAYQMSKDLVCEKEVIKCTNIIKNKRNIKKHKRRSRSPNLPQIPDHPYRISIIEGSGSGKTNSIFNQINQQPDIYTIYSYTKDPYEAKIFINKRENTGLKYFNYSKASVECSDDMDNIYKKYWKIQPKQKT